MDIKRVMEIIKNEKECVKRGEICNRDCINCNLVMDSEEIIEAYNMAIKALEKENIYDDKEHYVTISKALYDKLNIDYEVLSQEPCDDALIQLKKYTEGKQNTDKVEINVLALNRIIKALSQEPCSDAISRPTVVKFEGTNMACMGGDEIMKEFENNIQQNNDKVISLERAKKQIGRWIGYIDQDMINRICMSLDALPSTTQKPIECEDAVSRQAVLEIAKSSKSNWIDNSVLFKRVNELPSVTVRQTEAYIDGIHAMGYREGYKDAQKQKSGHWIETEYHRWKCSVCREKGMSEWDNIHDVRTNFCPNCGARMVEPQESEDKE